MTATNARQKLIRLAKKLNCRLEFEPMWDLTAPPNHRFLGSGCHYIVFARVSGVTMQEVYEDALNRLQMGLEECHCGDCEP